MTAQVPHPAATDLPISLDASAETYELLSTPRRVATTLELADADEPLDVDTLAARVVARESEKSVEDVTDEERRAVLVSLDHSHLPRLDAHNVVEWDRTNREVAFADDPPLAPEQLRALLENNAVTRPNRFFKTLAQPRRRAIVALLADGEVRSVDELARQVTAIETGSTPETVPPTDVDRVKVSLHHSHLPALSTTGVLQYDPAEGVVER